MTINNQSKRSYAAFVKWYIAENAQHYDIYLKYAYECDNARHGEIDVLLVSKGLIYGKRMIVAATLVNELYDLDSATMSIIAAKRFFEKSAIGKLIPDNEPYTVSFPLIIRADYDHLGKIIEQFCFLGLTEVVFFHKDKKHEEAIKAYYWLITNGYLPKESLQKYISRESSLAPPFCGGLLKHKL